MIIEIQTEKEMGMLEVELNTFDEKLFEENCRSMFQKVFECV